MQKLHFAIDIDAPVHVVWNTMLTDETYREWTSVFHQGSYYEGSWEAGNTIRFLGPNEDGSEGGMIATVVENRTNEFLSLEYLGQIVDGVDDTTSELAKKFIGSHENYTFSESGGVTSVTVDIDSDDEFADMFTEAWPKALTKLKEIAES